ncbi:glycosyltransferase [Halothermothrix orenii]|uniref:Glycosyl transferase group 1 n=1 Tax=Halothermothrix orenii (strain H 168 / OCM 544 / DSM 9562) TaxID=373903 RepID=B8CZG4_HALOH|nr:glycosyltransferase [Halothermothrix orenii]ACL70683.1 hypothetical protein Hore_19360 [Halothermothrix orenii H 168]
MLTVLYPPTIDWDFLMQRPQHLMKQFAKHGWKVLYANKTQGKPDVKEVTPNLYVYSNFNYLLENLTDEVDILYISWARHHRLPGQIPHRITIYDCIDDFLEWEDQEKIMLKRADLVFTSSRVLYDKKRKEHDRVYLIRNGCDLDHIRSSTFMPTVLKHLKRPIIGFVGALGKWVDTEALGQVAQHFTTITIGPEFGQKKPDGIIDLGVINYNNLPPYYNNIDIGIIPFLNTRTARAANPIKMYEYLAAGKPVVASNLPELKQFPGHVYTVDNNRSFIDMIKFALKNNSPSREKKRIELARKNSWKVRFSKIKSIVEDYL